MAISEVRGSSDRSVLVLASLAGGPKHRYALIEDVREFAGVRLGPGTLYGCLSKLEAAGFVESAPGRGSPTPLPHNGERGRNAASSALGVGSHRRDRARSHRRNDGVSRRLFTVVRVLYPRAWRNVTRQSFPTSARRL